MREIKFRVRDIETKEIIGYEYLRENRWYKREPGSKSGGYNSIFKKEAIREQFTGLPDKNGVEIYEGDIISEEGAYILWDIRLACWCFNFRGSPTPSVPLFYDNKIMFEIISNIHEPVK